MSKNYEVYFTNPDSPMFLEQWLENLLQDNRELVTFSEGYWIFRIVEPLSTMECTTDNAIKSYGDFFDKAVIALGFSSAELPGKETEKKLLRRISDLFWLVNNLSNALETTYKKLPEHWRDTLPFSYFELMNKTKKVIGNKKTGG
jgi:hypothetical protein